MKRCCLIGAFLFLMLAACQRPAKTQCIASLQDELSAIDSLMQSRPDSALALLQASPKEDPYYQLLLSEALYKNDSAQLNRPELMEAMAHYDSLGCPFLSARCHYMNGVGYYEMDSVVEACKEYIKALEIMEGHFKEKDLVGHKAKFMALVYGHLCTLFTDRYLHVQAVGFAKQAYVYYQKQGALSWQSAWALHKIGMNYDMMDQWDSAAFYYHNASATLQDTNSLLFRDIAAHQAWAEFKLEGDSEKTIHILKNLLCQARSDKEYLARCLVLGELFYHEKQFDSAWYYLSMVYQGDVSLASKKQAAEWLVDISKVFGKEGDSPKYAEFLVPFANLSENQGFIKSQMMDVYQEHEQRKKDNHHTIQTRKNYRQAAVVIIVAVLSSALLTALVYLIKTKQLKNERQEYKIKNAALAGRLKRSNEALKKERENKTILSTPLSIHRNTEMKYEEEPICRHILSVCNDERNPIKSNLPYSAYANIALTKAQEAELKDAANRHFGQLFEKLNTRYPRLKEKDFLYFSLCLLGLDTSRIAVMMQLSYRTVWQREKRLQGVFNTSDSISGVLHSFFVD